MTADSDRVEQQAAQWLVQIESQASVESWAGLDRWLALHPRHRAVFVRLSIAWRRADELASLREASLDSDENFLSRQARGVRALRRNVQQRGTQLAASIALALIVVGIAAFSQLPKPEPPVQTYSSQIGELQSFTLNDGTRVVLNTDSRLLVRYAQTLRELTLVKGEIALQVHANPNRTFDFHTQAGTFRVLGTAFTVRVQEDGSVEIAVTEGRVAIESDGILSAGEMAILKGGRVSKRKVGLETLQRRLAWTQGRLTFDGETLSAAAAQFNRYNQRQLSIGDRRLARLKIFGSFEVHDPEMFATALEEPFGLQSLTAIDERGRTVIQVRRRHR